MSKADQGAGLSRRSFFKLTAGSLVVGAGAGFLATSLGAEPQANVWIGRAPNYKADLVGLIAAGLAELGVDAAELGGKRVLLKPNLVEPHAKAEHINTHPKVVRAACEAFRKLGAQVWVGEAPGHRRDSLLVLEESGYLDFLLEDKIPFLDFNYEPAVSTPSKGRYSKLKSFYLPAKLASFDLIVSVAKLKTHHWAGATLAMKNLFGLLPGTHYGWPKNVLHHAGLMECIVDINATVRPKFAIVDGITGMQGDGPIMGTPRQAGLLVMGRNPPAVDATCARLMNIDPHRLPYLEVVDGWLGLIRQESIVQRGERLEELRTNFELVPSIPAHQAIRPA